MSPHLERLPYVFLVIALLSSIAGVISYLLAWRAPGSSRSEIWRVWGRSAIEFSALMTGLSFIWLTFFFIRGEYRFDYVYQNSSSDLSLFYRIGAVWAGQEGSFLLWAVWTAVVGVFLAHNAGRAEATAMPFYALGLAFVLMMSALVNPFETNAAPRPDGLGLNPLLHDPWMVLHPPALFLGYALTGVPFALAMGALVRRDYRDWVFTAAPWAVLSATALVTALAMGGHWAYRTLGWGGFWGWDPVENSSLVPMLLSTALVHTMLLQRGPRSPAQRANVGLAIVAYLAMLYAGYLTRSGVLTRFSNHSFSELPHAKFLLAGLVFFGILGGVVFLARYRGIPSNKAYDSVASLDFGLYLSAVVLGISAALVAVGTSTPIITGWFGKASTVQSSFYDWTLAPVGVLVGVLMAVYPLASRDGSGSGRLLKSLTWPLVLAVIATLAAVWLGRHLKPPQLAAVIGLTFSGTLAAALNLGVFIRMARTAGILSTGGHLAHVGVGLLLAGTVVSAVYTRTERVRTDGDGTGTAFGYRYRLLPDETVGGARTVIPIWATRQGLKPADGKDPTGGASWIQRVTGQAGMMFRPAITRDRMGNQMTAPGIFSHPTHDVYVAPVEYDPGSWESTRITVGPDKPFEANGVRLYFMGLEPLGEEGSPNFGVQVRLLAVRGKEHRVVTPQLNLTSLAGTIEPLPGGGRVNISAENDFRTGVNLDLIPPNARKMPPWVVVDVTMKPFISLVWAGMVLSVLGGAVAVVRRSRQAKRIGAELMNDNERSGPSGVRSGV
jgi:cytochrome c-type biogenesis protein CcmF